MLTVTLLTGLASGQSLVLDGRCPGPVTLEVTDLTPGTRVAVLGGMAGRADDTLGVGPCTGTETGLSGIRVLAVLADDDRDGRIRVTPSIRDASCDIPLQVLDAATCDLTEVRVPSSLGACGAEPACRLTGSPAFASVFDDGDSTYYFTNNLVGSVWHGPTDQLLTGHGYSIGYFRFPAYSGDYPDFPTEDTDNDYGRLVLAAATGVVVHNAGGDFSATPARDHLVGVIDPGTGELSGFEPAVFLDGFDGMCNLISASADEFLCYDGSVVRHYATTHGSPELDLTATVALAGPLPDDPCDGGCYGGRFAWDGANYYFVHDGNSSSNLTYHVYDAVGAHEGTYDAAGSGALNSVYFDWSVCRYTSHDGFGNRWFGTQYTWAGGGFDNDSQTWGLPSSAHEVVDACD